MRVIRHRNGGFGGTPARAERTFCRAKLGDVVYLFVERFRLRRGLGAVGEKHTTAAGWEVLSIDDNTNAGKNCSISTIPLLASTNETR